MPASGGRSVARGSIFARGTIVTADGDGGSKAASATPEAPLDVDPFFEAAAAAVSSATATAAFRTSVL
jgi:hypothetical protein